MNNTKNNWCIKNKILNKFVPYIERTYCILFNISANGMSAIFYYYNLPFFIISCPYGIKHVTFTIEYTTDFVTKNREENLYSAQTTVPNTSRHLPSLRIYLRLTSFNILFPNEQFYRLCYFHPMNTNLLKGMIVTCTQKTFYSLSS